MKQKMKEKVKDKMKGIKKVIALYRLQTQVTGQDTVQQLQSILYQKKRISENNSFERAIKSEEEYQATNHKHV